MANAKGNPNWKPGKSGNPNGRPPKSRALTAILERAGSRTYEVDGQKLSGKRLLARLVWDAIATGTIRFPDGSEIQLSFDDWMSLSKWAYQHIDGPPPIKQEHGNSDGQPFRILVEYADDNAETSEEA